MLTEHTVNAFHALSDVIHGRALGRYEKEQHALSARLNARGLYNSGHHVKESETLAETVLDETALEIYEALLEAHGAEPIGDPDARIFQLQELCNTRVRRFGEPLFYMRDELIKRLTAGLQRPYSATPLENRVEILTKHYGAKIQLAITGLAHNQQSSQTVTHTNQTINIQGSSVGSLQTGNQSHATVNQAVIAAPSNAETASAIDALISALEANGRAHADTIEVLQDIRLEALKPKANRLRVGALIEAASKTVAMIPATVPAWDTVTRWFHSLAAMVPP